MFCVVNCYQGQVLLDQNSLRYQGEQDYLRFRSRSIQSLSSKECETFFFAVEGSVLIRGEDHQQMVFHQDYGYHRIFDRLVPKGLPMVRVQNY